MLIIEQIVRPDARGWTKDNFDPCQLVAAGFPTDFSPVANRISSVDRRGFTRGVHADAVAKFNTVVRGAVFTAVVDLREGPGFGALTTTRLTPERAIYLPRGCANAYQAITDDVVYVSLEDRRVSMEPVVRVKLDDPDLAIPWPIAIDPSAILADDLTNPRLIEVEPLHASWGWSPSRHP